MAINITNEGIAAVHELKDSSHMGRLIETLGQVALKRVIASVASPVEQRIAQTSHAHGVWELYEALEAAYQDVKPSQLAAPLPPTIGAAARRGRVAETAGV